MNADTLIKVSEQAQVNYRMSNTGRNSDDLGKCEVCGKHCSEVHLQTRSDYYRFEHDGEIFEGWSQAGGTYGHKECLESKRITV